MRYRSLFIAGAALAILAFSLTACASGAAQDPGIATLATATPGASPLGSADPSASPSADPSAAPTDPREALLAYAQCMRDHGVDMPDPVFEGSGEGGGTFTSGVAGGPGVNGPEKVADEACRHFMASITINDDGPSTMPPEEQQAFLDFAQCMRDHGVDMPDPQFRGGGVMITVDGSSGGSGLDASSAAFGEAQKACQHVLSDAGIDAPGSGAGAAPGSEIAPGNAPTVQEGGQAGGTSNGSSAGGQP